MFTPAERYTIRDLLFDDSRVFKSLLNDEEMKPAAIEGENPQKKVGFSDTVLSKGVSLEEIDEKDAEAYKHSRRQNDNDVNDWGFF